MKIRAILVVISIAATVALSGCGGSGQSSAPTGKTGGAFLQSLLNVR
jgi:hypothetical protein